MISISIGGATSVYNNASRCEILRHRLDHPGLAELSHSLRDLARSLGDEAEDDFWRQTLGPIRRLAFTFCSVPLPFAQAAKAIGFDWNKIHRQVKFCEQMFPDSHKKLEELTNKLEQLNMEDGSPFIQPLEELIGRNGSLSVMIRNPRMNQVTATYFANTPSLRKARIASAAQLRGAHFCDILVTIGPCGWFPEYVFSAPRATTIHVISFRWIHDDWRPGSSFLHRSNTVAGKTQNHFIGSMPRLAEHSATSANATPGLEPADLLPPMPTFTRRGAPHMGASGGAAEEIVPARLCYLSGNRAVFVPADDGATSLIIDTAETGLSSVRRAPTSELEEGQYILLRTSGGGDLIAPLADRILGDLAVARRTQQTEWKQQLISKAVDRFGPLGRRELASRLCSELRSRRMTEARPANVHYWMSAKCISPRELSDFAAIMTFAELEDKTQDLWAAMQEIARAHTRAGFLIRRMLLQRITETSLESLERDGEMVFDLGELGGGTLSAFRIIGMQKEHVEIPADQLAVLMDGED
jgi:hypothetical protein